MSSHTKKMAASAHFHSLECPVCFDAFLPPVYQCPDGHLICSECIPRVSTCPLCRKKLPGSPIRNRAIEDFLAAFLLKCPSHLKGCKGTFRSPEEMDGHEIDCEFGSTNFCSMIEAKSLMNCPVKLVRTGLLHHLEHHHKWVIHFPRVKLGQNCKLHIKVAGNLSLIRRHEYPSPSWWIFNTKDAELSYNAIFLLKMKHVEARTYLVPYVIGSASKAALYYCKLELMADNRVLRVTWEVPVLSIQAKREEEVKGCSITEETVENFRTKSSTGAGDHIRAQISFHRTS